MFFAAFQSSVPLVSQLFVEFSIDFNQNFLLKNE